MCLELRASLQAESISGAVWFTTSSYALLMLSFRLLLSYRVMKLYQSADTRLHTHFEAVILVVNHACISLCYGNTGALSCSWIWIVLPQMLILQLSCCCSCFVWQYSEQSVLFLCLQEVFPVQYGTKFDTALQALTAGLVCKLEQLLPVPNLSQVCACTDISMVGILGSCLDLWGQGHRKK